MHVDEGTAAKALRPSDLSGEYEDGYDPGRLLLVLRVVRPCGDGPLPPDLALGPFGIISFFPERTWVVRAWPGASGASASRHRALACEAAGLVEPYFSKATAYHRTMRIVQSIQVSGEPP